jgi:hypothetical protein
MTERVLKPIKRADTLIGLAFKRDEKAGISWTFKPWTMTVDEEKVQIGASMFFDKPVVNAKILMDAYRLDWSVKEDERRQMPLCIGVRGASVTFIGDMMDVEALNVVIGWYASKRTITYAWADSPFCTKLDFEMNPGYHFKALVYKEDPTSDVIYTVLKVVEV